MTNQPIVLVTHLEYDKGKALFETAVERGLRCMACPAAEAELAAHAREVGAKAVIVGVDAYKDALYHALPRGGAISRFGVGHDGIDKAKATEHGLVATYTPGVLTAAVAEHTIWLMGCLARNIAPLDRALKAGRWEPVPGMELAGKTLAVIGLGGIGRAVAKFAGLGLGMRVVAWGRSAKDKLPAKLGVADWAEAQHKFGLADYTDDLGQVMGQADIVTVHIAATPDTVGFFDAVKLALIKPGALFINTTRGSVVDEAALCMALKDGRLAGAALDVFAAEPYKPLDDDHDLRKLPRVLLTPHLGSNTAEANARMAVAALDNVAHVLAGDFAAASLLNPEVVAKLKA